MNLRILAGLALASILALAAIPAAHADDFDQATLLTFNAPVRVPGKILPAGSYLFVLAAHGTQPGIVQIFNPGRTRLYGSFVTIHAERQGADGTLLALAKPDTSANPDADVPALTKWFYPGRSIGQEFLYSNRTEKEIRHEQEVFVPASSQPGNAVAGD